MRKKFKLLLVTILLFFLETQLARFRWNGVALPLTFTFGLAMAVVGDEWDAIFMALVTGFLGDLYSTHLFGLNMLLNLYVFLGIHMGKSYLRQEKNLLMAVVMAGAAFLRYTLHYGINALTGLPQTFRPIPLLSLMVLVLGLPFLLVIRRLYLVNVRKTRLT
ncbi:MAG: rod shape-determining protein MreD [Clostridiaceae bacterium]